MKPVGTIFVFEKSPRWGPELERQFDGEEVRIRSCRSTADLQSSLTDSEGPAVATSHVILLDLDSNPADCLQFLGRCVGNRRCPPIFVMASRKTAELEWSVRELGALDVIVDYIPGDRLARLCRRLLASA